MFTSLLVGKTKLALDATIACLQEAERLMMQESSDTYHTGLMVAKAYNNKKKDGKNNSEGKMLLLQENWPYLIYLSKSK